jgi:recombination protein RecR
VRHVLGTVPKTWLGWPGSDGARDCGVRPLRTRPGSDPGQVRSGRRLVAAAAAAGGEEKRQCGERREHQCEPKAGHVGNTRKGHGRIRGHNASAVFSPSVENLVAQLTRLPGVGQRTAQRLAFHILQRPADEALALAAALTEVKERVRFCRECGNLTEEETCAICLDARRDHATICVVEQPVDVVSLERTHEYRGLYHVLGGALSPIDGVEPSDLRIDELVRRVEANGVREVVLATNPTMTGEATAAYLADRLRDRVRVTRLASGLPVGGDLEYADEVTLGRALAGRREM